MNTLLHCELNSEQVPESMQVDLLSLGGTPTHPYHPLILDATDGIFSHAHYFRYSVPDQCIDFIKQIFPEIQNENIELGLQHIKNMTDIKSALLPHTDGANRGIYVFSYLIDAGNKTEDVVTYWWKDSTSPLVRHAQERIAKYNNLIEIDKTIVPANRWVFLRANILHSVHNIDTDRIALTFGTNNKELANRILKNHTTDSKQIED